jgi:Ca2+-binding EF-hand superfamily protein
MVAAASAGDGAATLSAAKEGPSPSNSAAAASPPNNPSSPPKATPRTAGKTGGGSGAKKAVAKSETQRSFKKKDSVDHLTTEYLLKLADDQEATAAKHEAAIGKMGSLPAKLGEALQQKMEGGMKAKDFFDIMDKNGDGSISKMEFRQSMRELGLMKESGSSKEVDALFAELDSDGGGDLDLQEITKALKDLRLKAKEVAAAGVVAKEQAAFWKQRAEQTRAAAATVTLYEEGIKELAVAKEPTAAVKLSAILVKKNLKPADILTQWDTDGGGSVGFDEFSKNLFKLGLDTTSEELMKVFTTLDKSGDGELDMEELRSAIKSLVGACEEAKKHEKRLAKDLVKMETDAREARLEIKHQLDEDERRREAESAAATAAAEEAAAAAAAVKAEAESKEAKRKAAAEKKRKEFEERVAERRSHAHEEEEALHGHVHVD